MQLRCTWRTPSSTNFSWDDNILRSSLVSRVCLNSTVGRRNNDVFRSSLVARISLNGRSLCTSMSVFLRQAWVVSINLLRGKGAAAVTVQSAKWPRELRVWNIFVQLVSKEQWIFWVDEICDEGVSSIYCFRSDPYYMAVASVATPIYAWLVAFTVIYNVSPYIVRSYLYSLASLVMKTLHSIYRG
jgi:hypothetical protein